VFSLHQLIYLIILYLKVLRYSYHKKRIIYKIFYISYIIYVTYFIF